MAKYLQEHEANGLLRGQVRLPLYACQVLISLNIHFNTFSLLF